MLDTMQIGGRDSTSQRRRMEQLPSLILRTESEFYPQFHLEFSRAVDLIGLDDAKS
jgi:hypothetical protein